MKYVIPNNEGIYLQAQRKHLKIDVQLKITEQGKQGTLHRSINLTVVIRQNRNTFILVRVRA